MKIKKIVLVTDDGKKIKLTLEQAKELHEQLNDLLGSNTTIINNTSSPYVYSPWSTGFQLDPPLFGDRVTCDASPYIPEIDSLLVVN